MSYRPAYTLIELVLSMSITTLLVGGMSSALVVASRAADTSADPAGRMVETRLALDQVTADLTHATSLMAQGIRGTAFTVPDRDNNGTLETITYTWDGSRGAPLIRQYNNGSATAILSELDFFSLTWLARPAVLPAPVESANSYLFVNDNQVGGWVGAYWVDPGRWRAQFFKPTLPTNAISWRVNSVQFVIDKGYNNETLLVEIRTASPRQTPTSTILGTVSVASNTMPIIDTWVQINFSGVAGLDPSAGVCLVLRQISGNGAATILVHNDGFNMPRNTHFMTSTNSGGTWSVPGHGQDMVFNVIGTVTTQGPSQ